MTPATAVTSRYPFASDFIIAVDDYWGQNGTMRTADPATQVAACPACRSKSRPEEHKRYPLVVSGGSEGAWKLARSCGCSADSIAAVLTEAASAGADIDGAALLDEIRAFIGRYMVLPSAEVADLLAVWTLHTHALDAAYATPYLRITSATKECGKTVLMEILSTLTFRGWHAVNPSAAVLYRKIDRQRPTLLLDEMDNFPIDDRRDALAVLNAGYKRGATIDRCMSGILNRAKRKGWITANPYDDAERVRTVDSGAFNVLTVEQVEAVARKAESGQEGALIRVAAYTGLRQGELRALRWRSVDFATATIHVKHNLPAHGEEKVPKSKVVRSVPLIDQAARALDELSRRGYLTAPNDRVFVSPTGGPLDDGDVRDGFYRALGRAGLGHLREQAGPIVFHDLRHTFGTLAVQVWPVTDVQAYMGHADIKTTMRYVHHVPKHDAAKRFPEFVASQSVSPLCPEPTNSDATERNSAQMAAA